METLEPLTVHNQAGLRLAAVLHRPEGSQSELGVVVAHGMLSSKESDKHRQLCSRMSNLGILALRFDFRGRGSSEGDPADLTLSNEIDDLQSAAGTLGELGVRRFGVIGSSLGGTVALLAAPHLSGLQALLTIASPAHLPDEPRPEWGIPEHQPYQDRVRLGPGTYLLKRFFTDNRRHDPVATAATIRCPWRIIHGECDEVVPVADAHDLAAANPAADLLLHPAADHRFSGSGQLDWLLDRVEEHIRRSWL